MDVVAIVEAVSAREVYGKRLVAVGAQRDDVVVLTADLLTSNLLGDFKTAFPDRFFNLGVAEANLMSVAAGLALEGFIPFVSTFAAFASMRAHEQVRTDIAYMNLPVKILATMSGLSGGNAGPTHASLEDLAVMRAMPNMTVIAPGDPLQMTQFVDLALDVPGPVYIRLGRGSDPVIYEDMVIEIGKAIVARPGTDVAIVACGTVMRESLQAHEILAAEGIAARVLDMHTVKPLDDRAVIEAAWETGHIITVEDHSVIGGLGSAVAEVVAAAGIPCKVRRLGIPDVFTIIGTPHRLFTHYGYAADGIAAAARELVQ